MKKVQLFSILAFSTLVFCFANIQQVEAQNPRTTSKKASTTGVTADPNLPPYCDEVLSKISETLQIKAERTCETQSTCVLCTERTAQAPVYMTLYIQPSSPKCRKITEIATVTKPPQQTLDLDFEIGQSICIREGISLMVNFPDARVNPTKYTYTWDVDGRRAGSKKDLNCICGKEAKVTIYEKGSKRSITKVMKLDSACATSKD